MKKFFEAHVDSPPVYPHLPPVANKLLWLRGFKIHIQVTIMKYILKWPYRQNFFHFPIWSYIPCSDLWQKKNFDLVEKWFFFLWSFFYEVLNPFFAVYPGSWPHHRHAQICDVDSGTRDFRLDLSRLFYLCEFSFAVYAKCFFPAFCMNY